MNCFKHNQSTSVGVCRNCFRGVCSNCAKEFSDGIACSDYCLEKAMATTQVVANTVLAQRGAKIGRFVGPAVVLILGLIYFGWAVYEGEAFSFMGAMGALFILFSIILLVFSRKYFKPINEKNT